MKKKIYNFLRKFFPKKLVKKYYQTVLSKPIIEYLKTLEQNDEIIEIIEYLKNNPPRLYPYNFPEEHKLSDVSVEYSKEKDRHFVFFDGKKLFFKKSWNKKQIQKYFTNLICDLDKRSPHSYFANEKYSPQKNDIIADVGAAEGIWALYYVDKCDKIYLFECDEDWIEALTATFEIYKEKVEIIQKEIGKTITIDNFFTNKKIDCIKSDIEGAEIDMLAGGKNTFCKKVTKVLICAYHNYEDEEKITNYLREYDFSTIETTKGFMIHGLNRSRIKNGKAGKPYISRGLILGTKNS